jgi:hypothetical protein
LAQKIGLRLRARVKQQTDRGKLHQLALNCGRKISHNFAAQKQDAHDSEMAKQEGFIL